MKRKLSEVSLSQIEEIVKDSLTHVGLEHTEPQAALLLRLIFSGIGQYFFFNPDSKFKIGFIEIVKSPNKEELFTVNIIRSSQDRIINADTLHKYYTGELVREEGLRDALDTFVNELLAYAQAQEISIASLTDKINKESTKKHKK